MPPSPRRHRRRRSKLADAHGQFIVPFGPGAGADIGAGSSPRSCGALGPAGGDREQAGRRQHRRDQCVPRAIDDHTFLFGPSGNFTVHPFVYSKLSYDPKTSSRSPGLQHPPGGRGEAERPLQHGQGIHRGGAQGARQVQLGAGAGHHRIHLLGLQPPRRPQITQVPYRDINVAPVDLGENRIQVVMASLAIVQPQWQAGRIKLIVVNGHTGACRRRPMSRPRAKPATRRSRSKGRRPVRAQDHAERA